MVQPLLRQCNGYQRGSLKVTALVDIEDCQGLDVHCTTSGTDDKPINRQVARRNASDWGHSRRQRLQRKNVPRFPACKCRPTIGEIPQFTSLYKANNVRLVVSMYGQRWMAETVFPAIQRTSGTGVRPRIYSQVGERLAMTEVYNIPRQLSP